MLALVHPSEQLNYCLLFEQKISPYYALREPYNELGYELFILKFVVLRVCTLVSIEEVLG